MSDPYYVAIPRTPDKAVIEAFRSVRAEYGFDALSGAAIPNIQLGALDPDSPSPDWETVQRLNGESLQWISMQRQGLGVTYMRGGHQSSDRSAIWDEIRFTYNANAGQVENDIRIKVLADLSKKLKAFDPKRAPSLSADAKAAEALHLSTLSRLEVLAEDVIRLTTEAQARIDAELAVRRTKIEQELADREAELEERLKAKRAGLDAREAEIDAKLKEIDASNNTHARREIRKRMLEDVSNRIENFGVSGATASKRHPVRIGMFLLIMLLLTGLLYTAQELHFYQYPASSFINTSAGPVPTSPVGQATKVDGIYFYILWARLSLVSLGLFAAILYYVRWENKWAEQHASAEFQLQQFHVDVNRANWVIESGLEWRKETGGDIPEQLMVSVTRNLFEPTANQPSEQVIHPADELASALLGTASKLKLKVGGNELNFDKPAKIPASVRASPTKSQ